MRRHRRWSSRWRHRPRVHREVWVLLAITLAVLILLSLYEVLT